MSRIVVIGSNSFSGSHFVECCLGAGHDVLAISRSKEPKDAFLPYRWDGSSVHPGRFEFLEARLPENIQEIERKLRSFEAEYVVNFAALGMVAESWQYPADYYKTNVVGNVTLHEVLRKLPSLRKYVHVSTPEVYGNTSGFVTENNSLNPTTPYAASRAACDIHLKTFLQQYDFPVVWTRAANVFGPGQQLYRIVPRTILAGLTGHKLQLHGGGTSERSFIHIADVCKATLKLALDAPAGGIYHLSTSSTISIRKLVETICDIAEFDFSSIVETADERPGKDSAYFLDSTKIREEFGWKDEISLEQGILETRDWVTSHLKYFETQSFSYSHTS